VISQRLVGMMGGKIDVESEPGCGSDFWFTATFDTAESEPKPVESPAVLASKRVLIVDDNNTNRTILHYQLAGWKMNVAGAAGSGREALSQLRCAAKLGEPFDVVALDMQMPEMYGAPLARDLLSRNDWWE